MPRKILLLLFVIPVLALSFVRSTPAEAGPCVQLGGNVTVDGVNFASTGNFNLTAGDVITITASHSAGAYINGEFWIYGGNFQGNASGVGAAGGVFPVTVTGAHYISFWSATAGTISYGIESGTCTPTPAPAAPSSPQQNSEPPRLIGQPNFVVFLLSSGALDYYEVVNGTGKQIGVTPAGWRNDSLGGNFVVHSVTRGSDGTQVLLRNIGGGRYSASMVRGGIQIAYGEFQGQGPSGSGVLNPTAPTTTIPVNTTTTTTTTTTFTYTSGATTSSRDNGPSTRAAGAYNPTTRIYVVAPGDHLYRIALRFNISLSAIMVANNIANPNIIYVGQSLRIP